MNNINDRAKEYSNKFYTSHSAAQVAAEDGFVIGAMKQRHIDIKKACEALSHAVNDGLISAKDVNEICEYMTARMIEE